MTKAWFIALLELIILSYQCINLFIKFYNMWENSNKTNNNNKIFFYEKWTEHNKLDIFTTLRLCKKHTVAYFKIDNVYAVKKEADLDEMLVL